MHIETVNIFKPREVHSYYAALIDSLNVYILKISISVSPVTVEQLYCHESFKVFINTTYKRKVLKDKISELNLILHRFLQGLNVVTGILLID